MLLYVTYIAFILIKKVTSSVYITHTHTHTHTHARTHSHTHTYIYIYIYIYIHIKMTIYNNSMLVMNVSSSNKRL